MADYSCAMMLVNTGNITETLVFQGGIGCSVFKRHIGVLVIQRSHCQIPTLVSSLRCKVQFKSYLFHAF
jgi:hypothetical protein